MSVALLPEVTFWLAGKSIPPAEALPVTVKVVGVVKLKVAVTLFAASIVTVQAPVPLHAPLQPVNVLPVAGVAVSVTDVPVAMLAEQVVPQFMLFVADVTVPLPVPVLATERAKEPNDPDCPPRTGQT